MASAAPDCEINQRLDLGQRGSDQVRCLQTALAQEGVQPGPVDGYYGPVTRAAVVAYQQANGLVVDGWVGRQTGGSLGVWGGGSTVTQPARSSSSSRSSSSLSGGTVWDRLAQCESGGNWHIATGNGYYGGLQFLPSTWRANGGSGMPHQASREEQIRVAENLRAKAGYAPWPACSAKLGLR